MCLTAENIRVPSSNREVQVMTNENVQQTTMPDDDIEELDIERKGQ